MSDEGQTKTGQTKTGQNRTVYTAIAYDHDRKPLEKFLEAEGYNVVFINVYNPQSLTDAFNTSGGVFAVVSSLINPLLPIDQMDFGDQLALEARKLSGHHLTIIFSSQTPSVQGDDVRFVEKCLFSRLLRDKNHVEIKGHLDQFFEGLNNDK